MGWSKLIELIKDSNNSSAIDSYVGYTVISQELVPNRLEILSVNSCVISTESGIVTVVAFQLSLPYT